MSQNHFATSPGPSPDAVTAGWAASVTDADPNDALSCPGCGAPLAADAAFERYRVCPRCERHFPLPARERLALLADAGSFAETNGVLVALTPLIFRDHLPLPATDGEPTSLVGPAAALGEAVISGTAAIGGLPVALLVLDHTYLGGNLGPVAAEKVTLAIELAASRRLPLIALCAASYPGVPNPDESRPPGGLISLAQWPKIAAAAGRLRDTGSLFVAVLAHPTVGGVFAGLGQQADIVLAEPGAQVGSTASGGPAAAGRTTAEALLAAGQLDAVIDRRQLAPAIGRLLALLTGAPAATPSPTPAAPAPPPAAVPASPPSWTELNVARHPARPAARDLMPRLVTELQPLHGDRISGDDPALIGGVGRIGGRPVVVVTASPPADGGAPVGLTAAGYRTAARLIRLAARFELPVVTLIDAMAPEPPPAAAAAVADLLALTSRAPVPLVSCVVGVGAGLELMALGGADRRLMLQHAMLTATPIGDGRLGFSPIAPTGAGWQARAPVAAAEALRLGLIDQVVAEPVPGTHVDIAGAAALLVAALSQAVHELSGMSSRRLVAARGQRLRAVGIASPAGHEAARWEIRDLQERQRRLAQSLADWRERWRTRQLPRLSRPSRPGMSARARPGALDPARLSTRARPELADLAGRIAEGVRQRTPGGREGAPTGPPPAPPRRGNGSHH